MLLACAHTHTHLFIYEETRNHPIQNFAVTYWLSYVVENKTAWEFQN